MYKTALTTTAFIFCASVLAAQDRPHAPEGDLHKIFTTYSAEEQEYRTDVLPAAAVEYIKAVYAADFADATPAPTLVASKVVPTN